MGDKQRRTVPEQLVAEIGSTVTKLTAFTGLRASATGDGRARFVAQGAALSTVAEGDVVIGLERAREDLEARIGVDTRDAPLAAASSAAGGLRMTVHGLTARMTLRAAREASLGAGAVVVHTTAGAMTDDDVAAVAAAGPKLVLLAGGVDDGERDAVIGNATRLARLEPAVPVVFAGNRAARADVRRVLEAAGVPIFVVDNVYPRIDELNLEPVRECIQAVFADHIVSAPGMDRVRRMCGGPVVPTPGAVLRATELLADALGDVMTVDVGGATTDVHSVTRGLPERERRRVAPEPRSKRTVEGDLGVYLNADRLARAAGDGSFELGALEAIPHTEEGRRAAIALARVACRLAIQRHAGERRTVYGAFGVTEVVEGCDLGAIRWIVGTGGALTRLGAGREILEHLAFEPAGGKLLPPPSARILVDRDYVMASAGVLGEQHPRAALELVIESIGLADGWENGERAPLRRD